MQEKICPCCKAKISFKIFLKGIIKTHKRNAWTENEKGLVCIECNKQILSAERKTKFLLPIILVSMIPSLVYVLSLDGNYNLSTILIATLLYALIIPVGIFGIYKIYQKVELVCNDSSSFTYDHEQIH